MPLWKLAVIVHTVVGPTMMGALVIVALLVPEFSNARGIIVGAIAGAILSFPLSYYVAHRMLAGQRQTSG
jgi:hypothetical protein